MTPTANARTTIMPEVLHVQYESFRFQSHAPALPARVDFHKETARDFGWESMPACQEIPVVRRVSAKKFPAISVFPLSSRNTRGFCETGARIHACAVYEPLYDDPFMPLSAYRSRFAGMEIDFDQRPGVDKARLHEATGRLQRIHRALGL